MKAELPTKATIDRFTRHETVQRSEAKPANTQPTTVELATLAATLRRDDPEADPASLARRALELWNAAQHAPNAEIEVAAILAETLNQPEGEWCARLLGFAGDRTRLGAALTSQTLPRETVLRALFRNKSETHESRAQKFATWLPAVMPGAKPNEIGQIILDYTASIFALLRQAPRSFQTLTAKCRAVHEAWRAVSEGETVPLLSARWLLTLRERERTAECARAAGLRHQPKRKARR